MITLSVNGRQLEFPQELTGGELLDTLEVGRATVVVELNGRIVPRAEFFELMLADGDSLELVTVVGGG